MTKCDKGKIDKSEPNKRGRKPQWTEEKIQLMCDAIAGGKSHKEAYMTARVSHQTFYRHMKEDSEFCERIKAAEKQFQEEFNVTIVQDCQRSLAELIRGFEYDEVTTETGKDPRTGKEVSKKKVVRKRVLPNVSAIIFTLCNRDPEHWQNRVSNELSGKVTTESTTDLSLANVPDELLAKVIDLINPK